MVQINFWYLHRYLRSYPLQLFSLFTLQVTHMGHAGDADPPNHRLLTAETIVWNSPCHCLLHGHLLKVYNQIDCRTYTGLYEAYFWGPWPNAHVRHLTSKASLVPPSHGATTTPANALPWIIPWELPHTQLPGIQDRGGRPGGMDWRLWTNDIYGYQDHRQGVLLTQYGIQRVEIWGTNNGGWQHAGGIGCDRPEPTSGLEHQENTLSRAELDDLRCRPQQMDPAHQS